MLKIGITGAGGRMGKTIGLVAAQTPGLRLAGGSERQGGDAVGRDLGEVAGLGKLGIAIAAAPDSLFAGCDVVIDFTMPAATVAHAGLAARSGKPLVIGTTGLTDEQEAALKTAAEKTAIVYAANYSIGVNVMLGLTKKLAGLLDAEWDIDVLEMHHRMKIDAPSGTALALGRAAAAGRGVDFASHADLADRNGKRKSGNIGFAALRGGNVVGDHTVIFAADNERIEISHKAADRAIFARGAVRAAVWAADQKPGLYSMADVLGMGD